MLWLSENCKRIKGKKMKHNYIYKPESHEYWDGNIRMLSVSQILNESGYEFKGRPSTNTERGTFAHQTIELWEKGMLVLDTLDPILLNYLNLYIAEKDKLGFKVIETELQMYSKQYPIAGTCDLILMYNGIKTVADIKTGQPNSKRDRLQTAGYMMLYNELNPKNPVKQRLMIYIDGDNSNVKTELLTNSSDVDVFRACIKMAFYKIS